MGIFAKPRVNKIVLILIYSDFLLLSASGFLSPIFAVFLTTQINGGSLTVAGFATTIFWIVKSVVQIPVSWYADKIKGEKDDFYFIFIGSLLSCAVPVLYFFFASEVWHVYLLEVVNGIGYGMMTPTWLATFTRHIDKGHEGMEWMLHSNAIGFGFAAAAGIGGVLADRFGFRILFLLVSFIMLCGALLLLYIRKELISSGIRNGGRDGVLRRPTPVV
jgi:MFS family permease